MTAFGNHVFSILVLNVKKFESTWPSNFNGDKFMRVYDTDKGLEACLV